LISFVFNNSGSVTEYNTRYSNLIGTGAAVGDGVGKTLRDGVALGPGVIVGEAVGMALTEGEADGFLLSLGSGEDVGSV
jgi:hypothetical protein